MRFSLRCLSFIISKFLNVIPEDLAAKAYEASNLYHDYRTETVVEETSRVRCNAGLNALYC